MVTGGWKQRQAAAQAVEPARETHPQAQHAAPREPSWEAEAPSVSVRPAAGEVEAGLDIPAFLRRQSS
jgi:cell division protein FtsZ